MKLTEAIQINEGKFSSPVIAYHGTRYKNLQTILSQGLMSSKSGTGWGSSIKGSEMQKDKKSVGGVYFTTSASMAVRITPGEQKLLVIAQVEPRSSYSDEDDIDFDLTRAMKSLINTNSIDQMMVEYLILKNSPDDKTDYLVDKFIQNLQGRYGQLLMKNDRYNDLIKDYIYTGIQRIIAQKFTRGKPFFSRVYGDVDYVFNISKKEAKDMVDNEYENFISAPRAEMEHKEAIRDMTVALKRVVYDSDYMEPTSTLRGRTFRIEDDINYRGVNRILSIVVIGSKGTVEETVYGEIPPSAYNHLEDERMITGYDYEDQ